MPTPSNLNDLFQRLLDADPLFAVLWIGWVAVSLVTLKLWKRTIYLTELCRREQDKRIELVNEHACRLRATNAALLRAFSDALPLKLSDLVDDTKRDFKLEP